MSSKAKHAQRSRRSYTNNSAVFSKFEHTASHIRDAKKLKSSKTNQSILDRIKKLFRTQGK